MTTINRRGFIGAAGVSALAFGGLRPAHAQQYPSRNLLVIVPYGPGGGSDKKPVGTVVFGRARKGGDAEDIAADKRYFGDLGRGGVRLQAALCALELLMPGATLAGDA